MADHTLTAASPTSAAVDHGGGAATIHIYGTFDDGIVKIEGSTDGGTEWTPLSTERGFQAAYKQPVITNVDLRQMKLRFTATRPGASASILVDYGPVFT